jgi:hypothetical protein
MSLADFEAHLKHPSPAFRCYAAGNRAKNASFLAAVRNEVNPPADDRALSTIEKLLGSAAATVRQFYAKHDGVLLYQDTRLARRRAGPQFYAAGVAFFSVNDWEHNSKEMRERLVAIGWSLEEMPGWLQEGIAFGEIPRSANYFVIQPSGENAGNVFYANHDAFEQDPLAGSFEEFLDSILADPANFLYRRGCYTRYSDGETDLQWIPKEYVEG